MSVGVVAVPIRWEPGWPPNRGALAVTRWRGEGLDELSYYAALPREIYGPLRLSWFPMEIRVTYTLPAQG